APAHHMARELPPDKQPLPILKVLYRNTNRIQEHGGRPSEVLHPAAPAPGTPTADRLRDAVHAKRPDEAAAVFSAPARGDATAALDLLLYTVEDATEVHRVVLPYRAWDLLPVIGKEHAHTLLRQSVRYCVKNEDTSVRYFGSVRTMLPRVLEKHHLLDGVPA